MRASASPCWRRWRATCPWPARARAALREVAGDAALTFDPHSPPEIAAAIERLVAGGPDVERLRRAGRERAARFTWAATARATLASYRRTLGAVG